MKKLLFPFIFLYLIMGFAHAQVDFSLFMDEKRLKKEGSHIISGFRDNGSWKCLYGDCKNGEGVVRVGLHDRLVIFIAGKFSKKKIEGDATILYLTLKGDRDYFDQKKLETKVNEQMRNIGTEKVYKYYQNFKGDFTEAYYGKFSDNILLEGLYQFSGTMEEVPYRMHKIPLKHMYHVRSIKKGSGEELFPKKGSLIFNYRGQFKPEYGELDPAFTLNRDDDHIEIVPSWTHDIIVKSHPIPHYYEVTYYNKNGQILNEVLSHHNMYGTVGWQKEFVPGAEQALSTIATKYSPIMDKASLPHVGIVSAKGNKYKDGTFYGWMENGKPANYGIFMNEYYLYEGFFNEKGEFDGNGFLTLRKPISKLTLVGNAQKANHFYVKGFIAGYFSNGTFKEGITAWADNRNYQGHSPDCTKFVIREGSFTNTNPVEALNFEQTTTFATDYKFHHLTGKGTEYYHLTEYSKDIVQLEYLLSAGNYTSGKLQGEGVKKKDQGKGYWEGEFVDGEITEASKKAQVSKEWEALKLLEQKTLAETPYPLGSIIKSTYGYYYVNELFTNGCIDVCILPIEKSNPDRDKNNSMGSNIYYNAVPILWARTYFGLTFRKIKLCKSDPIQSTNHTLCDRCNGFGKWSERVAVNGTNTETTTRWTRTYEGVFYDKYENVTTTKSVPVTTYETKQVTCPKCRGEGIY